LNEQEERKKNGCDQIKSLRGNVVLKTFVGIISNHGAITLVT